MPLASVPIRAKPEWDPDAGEWRLVPDEDVDPIIDRLLNLFYCLQDRRGRHAAPGATDVLVDIEECPARKWHT